MRVVTANLCLVRKFVSSILGSCKDPTVLQNNEYSTFEQELYRLIVVKYCNTVISLFFCAFWEGVFYFADMLP